MDRFHWSRSIRALPHLRYRTEIRRYLLLLLIPLLLLVLLYLNVNQVILQQTEEYAELMADHFYVQSSAMLHEMQLVGNAILRDSDVNEAVNADSTENMEYLYVCDIIRDSLEESPFVQHAYLVCEKSGYIYSDQGLFDGDSLSTILMNVGADSAELFADSSEVDFHVLNRNRMAPYCIISVREPGGTVVGSLIVTMRMMEFLRIFYGLDVEVCTVFNSDVYISSYIKNINVDGFDWLDEASVSRLVGKPVICVYLEQDNYTYMVAVSRESYRRPLYVIIRWFCIYAVAALVLGYVYLYFVSKRRYQRISAMVETLPESYTGDQPYEHVYENIRRSLEDYRTQRENLQMENRESQLYQLLTADQRISQEQLQSAGVDCGSPFHYVAAFFASQIGELEAAQQHANDAVSFLHVLFRSTICELAEQYQVSCAFCGTTKIGIAIFSGTDAIVLKDTVLGLSKNVVEILTSSYSMHVRTTISSLVTDPVELPDAYQETQSLRNFAKSIGSNTAVISQEDLQHSSSVLLNGDFIRQEQILISTILARKYDAIPSMVESILATHVSPLRKNYKLAQSRLLSIENVLVEGVRMSCIPGVSEEQNAQALSCAESVQQLIAVTAQVYGDMAEHCREANRESNVLQIACSYIAQNLSDQNLNVAVICETAGISVQRLTRMFQAEFHMAIAEYMNACRIQLAKELLPDKQLTIAQISQQVGYSNTDTFTRNFRKIEGITPSEYRKTI